MNNQLTLQEYINLLQSEIDTGKIDGSLPVAIRYHGNPIWDYWYLERQSTSVEKRDDKAIITY